jgi:hypothetical protein
MASSAVKIRHAISTTNRHVLAGGPARLESIALGGKRPYRALHQFTDQRLRVVRRVLRLVHELRLDQLAAHDRARSSSRSSSCAEGFGFLADVVSRPAACLLRLPCGTDLVRAGPANGCDLMVGGPSPCTACWSVTAHLVRSTVRMVVSVAGHSTAFAAPAYQRISSESRPPRAITGRSVRVGLSRPRRLCSAVRLPRLTSSASWPRSPSRRWRRQLPAKSREVYPGRYSAVRRDKGDGQSLVPVAFGVCPCVVGTCCHPAVDDQGSGRGPPSRGGAARLRCVCRTERLGLYRAWPRTGRRGCLPP